LNDQIKGRGNGISLADFLDISAENNFDAVSLTGYFFPSYPDVPKDEEIYNVKRRAYQLGLNIISLGVRNDFANPDPIKRLEDVKHVKEWIDVAVKLGVPVVRIFSGNMQEGYEAKREEIAKYLTESIKECVDYAEKKGIFIGVQNHGDFLKTADQTIELVNRVDSKSFGVIVDTGYFLTEDPYVDIAKVMPYSLNFLLKESYTINGITTKVDLNKIVKILKSYDFRGNIALETLAPKKSPKLAGTRKSGAPAYNPYVSVPNFYMEVKAVINQEYN
jgi:sugar phosphate isomerase/epimerase